MDVCCRNPNRTAPVGEDGPQRADVPLCSRTNGWSWPPHPFQLLAWLLYIFFAVTGFGVFVPLLPAHWIPAGYIVSSNSVFTLQISHDVSPTCLTVTDAFCIDLIIDQCCSHRKTFNISSVLKLTTQLKLNSCFCERAEQENLLLLVMIFQFKSSEWSRNGPVFLCES